jgi:two-component system LytT family sensor kinase
MPLTPLFRSMYRFILRYKILHIIFWVWVTISFAHELQGYSKDDFHISLQLAILTESFAIVSVYFTIYFLVPRYFNKAKYFQFVCLTLLTIIMTSVVLAFAENAFTVYVAKKHVPSFFYVRIISNAFDTTIKTVAFVSIFAVQNKIETDAKNKKLERDQLEAELNFLKAQINPHFLFNSINSIYVLIEEDKKIASETLLRFSELLRYQLYECSVPKMPLEKETDFIKNFIQLEKLRLGDHIQVKDNIEPVADYFEIAPFILLPFVENAFKHVSQHDDEANSISIESSIHDGFFHLVVQNTCENDPRDTTKLNGGIGLQNVKRRLELLYPGQYHLDIKKENNIHTVNLKLNVG